MNSPCHKKALCAAVGSLLVVLSANAADPVTITISGNVVASPCESSNVAVDLGQTLEASALQLAGSATDWVPFDLNLINCPAGTSSATVLFQGTADSDNPEDMYQNTGTATFIAVQVQGLAGEKYGNGKTATGVIQNNGYSYHLRARAWSQQGNVMPGSISAVVTATFTYQ